MMELATLRQKRPVAAVGAGSDLSHLSADNIIVVLLSSVADECQAYRIMSTAHLRFCR